MCVTGSDWLWHGPQHQSCWHTLFPLRNQFHIQFRWWGVIWSRALCIGSGEVFSFQGYAVPHGDRGRASISLSLECLLMPVPVADTMKDMALKILKL